MQSFVPTQTLPQILCCECGVPVAPNPANMCLQCIRNQVDITEGIPKQITLNFCKNCERFLQPPNHWVSCALESKELLSLFLKKLRGLNKVRLVDAGFVWTEPHSRRIKVKLTIQKEVFAATILQQIFVVDGVMTSQQCEDCAKVMAQNTWKAVVQVRQKVNHKKTFFFLEQMILKYNAHRDTVNIKETRDGLDFYYSHRNHAFRMLEFLQSIVALKYKTSEQLLSSDTHAGTSNYRFTYSAELVPICRDDLVCLPQKVAASLGGISQLVLCTKSSSTISLIDPNTIQHVEMNGSTFWNNPFNSLCSYQDLIEYYVMDVEPAYGVQKGKFLLADIHVAKVSDVEKNCNIFIARSHLGMILQPGDLVYGYDLRTSNFNHEEFSTLSHKVDLPDVILVRKSFSDRRKKNRARKWKLKNLAKTKDELEKKGAQTKMETDYEMFLRDLEEDQDIRSAVQIFKDNEIVENQMVTDDEDELEIPLEQLLDDLNIIE